LLKAYREQTGDLDQLYEKNVRRFLGSRGRVNRGMQQTLREAPETFGLYNNGITMVAADYRLSEGGAVEFVEPYIVNGCQTTRTIWEVFRQRLEAGGTGKDAELEAWRQKASRGVVVLKVVRVGADGDRLIEAITRFTNSQNAVREKDFIALESSFRSWARIMEDQYGMYLEIQRGGWESRRVFQRQTPSARQLSQTANAFDLLKVYGAGWLGEVGLAFGKNAPFLPNGSIFKKITNEEGIAEGEYFGPEDLYAAYILQQNSGYYDFGRGSAKDTRRQTRYLFYFVVIELA
jgi:hypothetical protein